MNIKAVFCDIDGTLVNDEHEITPSTLMSIEKLQNQKIKFVLVSGRSPSGIYSILRKYSINCPIISFNGAVILDEDRNIIYERGMTRTKAREIIDFIQENDLELTWNFFSFDDWITQNKNDPQVREEEESIKAESREGQLNSISDDKIIHNILLMCKPEKIVQIHEKIAKKFPDLTVVISSKTFIDIMMSGVNKATAVTFLCEKWDFDMNDVMAFGDNYNDCEMLEAVGHGIVMGNAPDNIKNRFSEVTLDNNHDGISFTLSKYKII